MSYTHTYTQAHTNTRIYAYTNGCNTCSGSRCCWRSDKGEAVARCTRKGCVVETRGVAEGSPRLHRCPKVNNLQELYSAVGPRSGPCTHKHAVQYIYIYINVRARVCVRVCKRTVNPADLTRRVHGFNVSSGVMHITYTG